MRKKTHPGEILMKEVITPNNLTIKKAAELLGVTLSKLTDLVEGKISIDEELAQSIKQAFGGNEKTVCIVGAIRGNEIQQLYMCSNLIKTLKLLEERRCLDENLGIMIVPSVNPYSLNTSTRFWATDNTDINRMFPGYDLGETTQRIADGFFQKVKDYTYGIHFTSFYLEGNFTPHVRIMKTGYENVEVAKEFGQGVCAFYDKEEYARIQKLYGSMTRFQGFGE